MNPAFSPTDSDSGLDNLKEYETKKQIHDRFKISYWRIRNAIRKGELNIYLIDNKFQIRISEATQLFHS